MKLSREQLRFIIENVDDFMKKDFLKLSNEEKFLMVVLHSAIGRYETDSLFNFKKLNQKKIKNITVLDSGLIDTIATLYDYANIALHSKNKLDEYVDNKHVSSTIYQVTQYLLIEAKYELNNTSFLEHLNLNKEVNEKNIIELYKRLGEAFDPIRNNMQLVWIRNQNDLKKYEDYYRFEIYSAYNND